MDRDDDGELDIDEIEQALDKIGLPLNRDESKRIVSKFSIRGTTIKYKTFVKALAPAEQGLDERAVIVDLLIDRLKRKLEERMGSKANAVRELKETFADFDRDNSGTISEGNSSRLCQSCA